MKLQDKIVWITDAGSASSRRIASKLRDEGAVVVCNYFPARFTATEDAAMSTGADPASFEAINNAASAILERYGRIDVLVHNNNKIITASLEDCTDEQFDLSLGYNVKSAYLYTQVVGRIMKAARCGNIVFVSSIHDEKPCGGAFSYSIAKGALKMLAKEMVLDMGPYNVRVNIIEAGPMEGEEKLFYSDMSPLYEHTIEKIANKKLGSMEDIANAVLFFASDDCSFANGSELRLDGGFLLAYYPRRINREAAIKTAEAAASCSTDPEV